MPLSRNRPQKFSSSSRSIPCFAPSELHALLVSHLSWILCRSPFSDSFRMAVDMSTARGESLGNVWISKTCSNLVYVNLININNISKWNYNIFSGFGLLIVVLTHVSGAEMCHTSMRYVTSKEYPWLTWSTWLWSIWRLIKLKVIYY